MIRNTKWSYNSYNLRITINFVDLLFFLSASRQYSPSSVRAICLNINIFIRPLSIIEILFASSTVEFRLLYVIAYLFINSSYFRDTVWPSNIVMFSGGQKTKWAESKMIKIISCVFQSCYFNYFISFNYKIKTNFVQNVKQKEFF